MRRQLIVVTVLLVLAALFAPIGRTHYDGSRPLTLTVVTPGNKAVKAIHAEPVGKGDHVRQFLSEHPAEYLRGEMFSVWVRRANGDEAPRPILLDVPTGEDVRCSLFFDIFSTKWQFREVVVVVEYLDGTFAAAVETLPYVRRTNEMSIVFR